MKRIIYIYVILSFFMFNKLYADNNYIKADDLYLEEFVDFYFGNLKDYINDNTLNELQKSYGISSKTMENMKSFAKEVKKKNGFIDKIDYEFSFSIRRKSDYYIEVIVNYDITENTKREKYSSVVNLGYYFWNGSDFRITSFNENQIEIKSLDYSKLDKIIKSSNGNKEINYIIKELENEKINTILNYIPYELDSESYSKLINDYAYFLSKTDRYKEAIPILERVLLLLPNRVVAYLNLGDCYYKDYQKSKKQSDKDKIIENYKKYVSLLKKDAKIPDRVKEMLGM